MSILQMCLSIPTPPRNLSSSGVLFGPNDIFLASKLSRLSIRTTPKTTQIRMGGGPRTYPGGVSKWQWKRMQAKKAKQLLKARLARERQIYEMRKRAELKAAVSELERPWEVVERAPKLFSVSADEQVKVLADRFQRPGGFDMWSEKDGPQLFTPVDGFPSARFFPKGVVHSIKPYGKIERDSNGADKLSLPSSVSEPENGEERNEFVNSGRFRDGSSSEREVESKNSVESSANRNGKGSNGRFRKKGKRRRFGVENSKNLNGLDSGVRADGKQIRDTRTLRKDDDNGPSRGSGSQKPEGPYSKVYDMSLQHDGSYGFQIDNWKRELSNASKDAVKFESF